MSGRLSICFRQVLVAVPTVILFSCIGSFADIVDSAYYLPEAAVVPTSSPTHVRRHVQSRPFPEERREDFPRGASTTRRELPLQQFSTGLSGNPSNVTER